MGGRGKSFFFRWMGISKIIRGPVAGVRHCSRRWAIGKNNTDRFNMVMDQTVGQRANLQIADRCRQGGRDDGRSLLNGRVAGNGFPLRFWATLSRIERGHFLVFCDPLLNLRVRYRENGRHCVLEPRERFRAFDHFRVGLHAS